MSEALDPIYRCDSCQTLVSLDDLHKHGSCTKCGNRRVRNVTIFNDEEKAQMEALGFHDFLAQFEEVAVA